MVSVVVVDDEAMVRSGFTAILDAAPDIDVLGSSDGPGALSLVRDRRPDLVLLDIRMPYRDGLTVLRDVRALPDPPVVAMLTTFDTDEHLAAATAAGAAGFLLKDTAPRDLMQYVRTLAAGGTVLARGLSQRLLAVVPQERPAERTLVDTLTPREREVLRLLATGATNAEIGQTIYVSTGTVKDTVSAVLRKLGVTTRVQVALLAERAGLLS